MKKFLVVVFILVLGVTFGIYSILNWYNNAIVTPIGISQAKVIVEVKAGDSIETIAENLFDKGLLKDKNVLLIYAKLNPSLTAGIQAGLFEVSPSNNVVEIMANLQKAKNKDDIRITIPEGLRYDEFAETLAKGFSSAPERKFEKADFIAIVEKPDQTEFIPQVTELLKKYKPVGKNLEGFLYPDTYLFTKDADAKQVVEKLVSTLFLKLSADELYAISVSKYDFYKTLTLASMIQREALFPKEMPMVANILMKRLEQGIDGVKLLQVDATLLYPAKNWKADAFALKQVDNLYNTYKYPGLIPGPICNPGAYAIQAVINPEENDYFYYLHDSQGGIHYAKNYSEHLANIKKYL